MRWSPEGGAPIFSPNNTFYYSTTSIGANFRPRVLMRKITPDCGLCPCHWALCPGTYRSKGAFLLFRTRYANSEWNMILPVELGRQMFCLWVGVLIWRASAQNLCTFACQTLRGALCPGLPYPAHRHYLHPSPEEISGPFPPSYPQRKSLKPYVLVYPSSNQGRWN